ncbi:MAG: IclR family transcriptional regulator [Bacillota bacterium]
MADRSSQNLSLVKTIQLLRQFTPDHPLLGVTEMAHLSGMPKSVVHRIVQTLESTGFLEQDPRSQKYRVGLLAYQIGSLYIHGVDLHQVVQEELKRLAEESTFTCYFGIRQGTNVLLLAVKHGSSPVRVAGQPGDLIPAHCAALGKALLAASPPAVVDEYLARPLPAWTAKTVTNPSAIREELEQIRERGYAISLEQCYAGTCAIGCVVREDIGAISLSVPVFAYTPECEAEMVDLVRSCAQRIARRVPKKP